VRHLYAAVTRRCITAFSVSVTASVKGKGSSMVKESVECIWSRLGLNPDTGEVMPKESKEQCFEIIHQKEYSLFRWPSLTNRDV